MPVLFDTWGLKEATEKLAPPTEDAKAKAATATVAARFYAGDHWQGGNGWIGSLPDDNDPERAKRILAIQQGFVFENAVKAGVDRHVAGVLGREPMFRLAPRRALKPKEQPNSAEQALIDLGEAALTGDWWDRRKVHLTLRSAAATLLVWSRAVLRLYVPSGLREQNGTVRIVAAEGQDPLAAALDMIYLDALDPSRAAVYTDPSTKREVGIFIYTDAENKKWAELTYLDEQRKFTVLRVIGESGAPAAAAFDLGGRLLMYQLEREPLVTDSVMQLQRVINHTRTNIARNVNLAGFPERNYLNAAPPGYWADASGNPVEEGTAGAKFIQTPLPLGASAVNFVQGNPIYDKTTKEIVGYTTPTMARADPVNPDSLIKVRDDASSAILGEVHQRHILISGDATASGESRKQARSEHEAELGVTAIPLNDSGRWLIDTALGHASALTNQVGRFAIVRPDFNVRIDSGPISSDEKEQNRADYQAGMLSREGAMQANGVADVDAEVARIEEEEKANTLRQDQALAALSPGNPAQPPQPGDPDPLKELNAA